MKPVSAQLSEFARSLSVETAFTVLAVAKQLKAKGKGAYRLILESYGIDNGDWFAAPFDAGEVEALGRLRVLTANST